ncbi:hypothetical protein PR048_023118 [Dryococelus australis]|uniref:Reverse transcriptase RNase H-like domain-containing protein n=1 Tax=Dryococelus australis TaxID=614101 RepID=A0ABQ9GT91_9NEOP|nr:hypothetical protein PR048_023118 [Dryococelus australis]
MDPGKIVPIINFPRPKNVKGIMRFIGMLGFIDDYTELCAPLNHLPKQNVPFSNGRRNKRKHLFSLQVDASSIALGGALLQDQGEGLKPIAFASTMSSENGKHLSAFEKEVLACMWGVKKFDTYLEHSKFHLFTNNQALTWEYSHPKQIGKIGRWIMRFNLFRFYIIHIRGKENVIGDCLSRMYNQDGYESSSDSLPINNCDEELSSDE